MWRLVLYWLLGMLTLSVGIGIVIIGIMAYEFFFEDYAFFIYLILFVMVPIVIGIVTETISDWQYNRKIAKKLKAMEEE